MHSPLTLFDEDLTKKIVFMPLSRALVESQITIGPLKIIPPGDLKIYELNPVPNPGLENGIHNGSCRRFTGQSLRELQSWATGSNLEIFDSLPCVCFQADIDWNEFLETPQHQYDIELLQKLSAQAEKIFDFLRLDLCRLDLPDTLPGTIGSWEDTERFLTALIYSPTEKESYQIAGVSANYSTINSGIGLDFDNYYRHEIPKVSDGGISGIVVHALSLLTDAMYARNDTTKFIRTMTLLEFLGNPNEYKQWQKLKGDIACHCVNDKKSYLALLERLKIITSFEAEEKQLGYRTLIVHNGKYLEEILPTSESRKLLFRELQGYCQCVIEDMIDNKHLTWQEFVTFRSDLKRKMGI